MKKQELINALLEAFPDEHIMYVCTELDSILHSTVKFLREKNWHIIIIPEFYKDGINYNVRVCHYNPQFRSRDEIQNNFLDVETGLYGDNGELSTYEEALNFGILWCLNIITSGKIDLR